MKSLLLAMASFFLIIVAVFFFMFSYHDFNFIVELLLGVIATVGWFLHWFGFDKSLKQVKLRMGGQFAFHIVEILGLDGLKRTSIVPRHPVHVHTFGKGDDAERHQWFLNEPYAYDYETGMPIHFCPEGVNFSVKPQQQVNVSHQGKLMSTALVKAYQEGKNRNENPLERYAPVAIGIIVILILSLGFIGYLLNGAVSTLATISGTIADQSSKISQLIESLPDVPNGAITIGGSGFTGETV
jgi:hypothetical protein